MDSGSVAVCETTPVECDDGLACNGMATCDQQIGCVRGLAPCVGRHCDEATNHCVDCLSGLSCDDGKWCTINDTCHGSDCIGSPRPCNDDIPCTDDSCDEDQNRCVHTGNSVYCEDGDPCTPDSCVTETGECAHGDPIGTADTCRPEGAVVSCDVPARLFVNNDDDNGNGIPDYADRDQMGMVDNELASATFSAAIDSLLSECNCVDTSEYHQGFVGAASAALDFYLTNTMTGNAASTDPPTTPFFIGAHQATNACGEPLRFGVHCCSHAHECLVESTPIQAVMVHSLTWEKADPSNFGVTPCRNAQGVDECGCINAQWVDECKCPNNGGRRIFPGKLSKDDQSPALRRQVKLVATLAPRIADVAVYFRVFDVDDPFDQIHGPGAGGTQIANVDLVDGNTGGPDNRPAPEGAGFV